jgi:death-on-curing protein
MVDYLEYEDVIAIHHETLRRLGEAPEPITRPENLQSALQRSRWAAHYEGADLVCQAARLATGITRARAFLDGNKRTAQRAHVLFLYINGLVITGDHLDLARKLEALADPGVNDDTADALLESWLRERVSPVDAGATQ